MFSKLIALPVDNTSDGFINELKNLIEDYKLTFTKEMFIQKLLQRSIYKRINDLIKYRRNYYLNQTQLAIYIDLVTTFGNINNINSGSSSHISDTKISLLSEFD